MTPTKEETMLFELEGKARPGPWYDGFSDGSGRIESEQGGCVVARDSTDKRESREVVIMGGDSGGCNMGVREQPDMDIIIHLRNHALPLIRAKNARIEELAEALRKCQPYIVLNAGLVATVSDLLTGWDAAESGDEVGS